MKKNKTLSGKMQVVALYKSKIKTRKACFRHYSHIFSAKFKVQADD